MMLHAFFPALGCMCRTPKQSAKMFSEVAQKNKLTLPTAVLNDSDFVMIEPGAGRATTKDAPPGQKE